MREIEILTEEQPPQEVFVCDHAGFVMKKISHRQVFGSERVLVRTATRTFTTGTSFFFIILDTGPGTLVNIKLNDTNVYGPSEVARLGLVGGLGLFRVERSWVLMSEVLL